MNKTAGLVEPHPVLASHYQEPREKQKFLRQIFDSAAPHYEKIAAWGFFGTGQKYRKEALERAGLKPGMRVLDVATGTGPTARAAAEVLQKPESICCVDPSRGMLRESLRQLAAPHLQGGADHLPLKSGTFDFVSMGFALRHVQALDRAFCEYHRVLRPGGKLLLMEIAKPRTKLGFLFYKFYFRYVIPALTRLFTGNRSASHLMAYYWETMDHMVSLETTLRTLREAGFSDVKNHVVLGIFHEYQASKPAVPGN